MQALRNNLATVAVAVAVVALIAVSFALAATPGSDEPLELRVHDGDGNVRAVDLSCDAEFTVETDGGSNTIVVENGTARIVHADCPNLDCTRQAAISAPGQQIICLPHRLWLEVAPRGSEGAQMDASAVKGSAEPDVDLVAR